MASIGPVEMFAELNIFGPWPHSPEGSSFNKSILSPNPVSYTHLDVYKRQSEHSTVVNASGSMTGTSTYTFFKSHDE